MTCPSISQETLDFDAVVRSAFRATHDGWSSDEVILNDELNQSFLKACQSNAPDKTAAECNWKLMNLRKAGKLNVPSTKRSRAAVEDVAHLGEMAARTAMDKHKVSIDQIMSDPELRKDFDDAVRKIDSTADLYRVRKSAFQLRKARKLKPELITRIADWNRQISTHQVNAIQKDVNVVPANPGIYIFKDKTGYLYIGQSEDLRERLKSHLEDSSNQALARYLGKENLSEIQVELHSFAPDSRAKETMIRRAYESELIQSRKPRFNIQP